MSKYLVISLLLATNASQANDSCVLQSKTVGISKPTVIDERSSITRTVIPSVSNTKKCLVDFRARIGSEWHSAFGEAEWDQIKPIDQTCAIAMSKAEKDLIQRISQNQMIQEQVMICTDSERHQLTTNAVGTVAELSQFRPHPDFTREFYHNGTRCRWFQDVQWTGEKIWNYQGIICQVNQNSWVVVDKF